MRVFIIILRIIVIHWYRKLTSLINSLQSQVDQINSGNIAETVLSMSQKLH